MYARSNSDHSDQTKRLSTTMKTGDATFYSDGTIQIIDMSNNQLKKPKRNSTGRQ